MKNHNQVEITLKCEKCNLKGLTQDLFPISMPEKDEDILKLLERFNYKKPIFLKTEQIIKATRIGYVLFRCPSCGFMKMVKSEIVAKMNLLNVEICKDCKLDSCLWINCNKGGYKGEKKE